MSSISGLTVLALSLGRINLLKENMIQAELPFCKQKNSFTRGTKQPSELAAVSCQSLPQSFAMKICAFSLHRAAQAFEDTTHWHVLQVLPCNKVKKVGWFQVMRNKASSNLYWSLGWRCQVSFCGLEKPQVPFFHITDISSVPAGATSKATG